MRERKGSGAKCFVFFFPLWVLLFLTSWLLWNEHVVVFSIRSNVLLQIQLWRGCGSFCLLALQLLRARHRQYVVLWVPSLWAWSAWRGCQPSKAAGSFFPTAFPHSLGGGWEMWVLPLLHTGQEQQHSYHGMLSKEWEPVSSKYLFSALFSYGSLILRGLYEVCLSQLCQAPTQLTEISCMFSSELLDEKWLL